MREMKILLIEDNQAQADLMLEVFSDRGLTCADPYVATNGEQALNMLYQREGYEELPRPNLILLDLDIPKVNGKQVLYEIKSDAELRTIPVLILTSSNDERDIKRCYQLHANAYMVKPSDYDSLLEMIKKIEDFWFSQVCYS